MVYKKYIKRGGKVFGPYVYESYRDENGNVRTKYISGPAENTAGKSRVTSKNFLIPVCIVIFILLALSIGVFIANQHLIKETFALSSEIGTKITGFAGKFYSFITSSTADGGAESPKDSEKEQAREEKSEEKEQKEEIKDENGEEQPAIPEQLPPEEPAQPKQPLREPEIPANETPEIPVPEAPANETPEMPQIENQTTTEIPIIPEHLIIPEENATETIPLNETTPINITEILANETLIENVTIVNETTNISTIISTKQYGAILGKPVKWQKKIDIEGIPAENSQVQKITIELPAIAGNVSVKKINTETGSEIELNEKNEGGELAGRSSEEIQTQPEQIQEEAQEEIAGVFSVENEKSVEEVKSAVVLTGGTIKNLFRNLFRNFLSITGRTVDILGGGEENVTVSIEEQVDENTDFIVEYYTDAPYAEEREIDNKTKEVRVIGPDEVHYENILAFSELPKEASNLKNIKLYWLVNGSANESMQEVAFNALDNDNNSIYDSIEWIVPSLSEQAYEIVIIEITKAIHLDENREFVSDIYEQVRRKDDIWSEPISNNEYARVTFEMELDKSRDITLYARSAGNETSGIEVYTENGNETIAIIENIAEENTYKTYLTGLPEGESHDTFDLKVLDNPVVIDWIVDPECPAGMAGSGTKADPCQVTDCINLSAANFFYTLQNSITSESGTCITISGENVTFDLNTYSIIGDTPGENVFGILVDNYKNITIRNGNIKSFSDNLDYGINLRYSSNSTLSNLNVSNNDGGIYMDSSINVAITDIQLFNNPTTGLDLETIENSRISNVNISGNGDYAFYLILNNNNNFSNIVSTGNTKDLRTFDTNTNNFFIDSIIGSYTLAASTFYFKNSSFGEIKFINTISGSGNNLFGNSTSDIIILNNSAYVNGSAASAGLNVSANISLYNLPITFSNPVILKNGLPCGSACSNFTSLNAGNVTFNVTSWSNYSIGEGVITVFGCMNLSKNGFTYRMGQSITDVVGTCLNITADNVALDGNGFSLSGVGAGDASDIGVYANQVLNITIRNFRSIEGFNNSIYFDDVTNSTIINNTLNSSTQGIYLFGNSNDCEITNNTVSSNYNGVTIYAGPVDANLTGNTIMNNTHYGMFIENSGSHIIKDTIIAENDIYDFFISPYNDNQCNNKFENVTNLEGRSIGYYNSTSTISDQEFSELVLCNADSSVISNVNISGSQAKRNNLILVARTDNTIFENINSAHNAEGIYINGGANHTLRNNTILNSSYNALWISGVDNSTIMNNNLSYSVYAIRVSTSDNNNVSNNNFNFNSNGIYIEWYASNNIISNNIIRNMTSSYGILLYSYASNNRITDNIIEQSPYNGITISTGCHNNEILNNTIRYFDKGISISANTTNTTFLNNNIYSNTFAILDVVDGTNYLIYNNAFGEIRWINSSFLGNLTIKGSLTFPGNITLANNSAYFNPAGFTGNINSSANVSLYNLPTTFADPIILKDGVRCTDCYNFTSLNAGTVIFNVTLWSNYSIADAPNTNSITLTSASGSNYINDNLNCYANITDAESNDVYANYTWFKNNVFYSGAQTASSFVSGTLQLIATLNAGSAAVGDSIICSIHGYDGISYESDWNNSTALQIVAGCGDGVCGTGESCTSCNTDCGVCPGDTGGGGEPPTPPTPPPCTPDCACVATTCVGSTCSDGCDGTCSGTLAANCGARVCGAAPNGCGGANACGTCASGYTCSDGVCVKAGGCVADSDCNDDNPCTDDKCSNGACAGTPMNCDDGVACTIDSCVFGICQHDTSKCSCSKDADCEDGNPCTDNTCSDSVCTAGFNTNNCNDNDACTTNDKCSNGMCSGTLRTCSAGEVCLGGECTEGSPPENIPANIVTLSECVSNFGCGKWSQCYGEYDVYKLIKGEEISGIQERDCRDFNGCKSNFIETKSCTFKVPVSIETKIWCNAEYMEIRDVLGDVLARLKSTEAQKEYAYLGVSFNLIGKGYCEYCYDKAQDYDEDGVDCGGSCIPCSEKKYALPAKIRISVLKYWISFFIFLMLLIFTLLYTIRQIIIAVKTGEIDMLLRKYRMWRERGLDVAVLERYIPPAYR